MMDSHGGGGGAGGGGHSFSPSVTTLYRVVDGHVPQKMDNSLDEINSGTIQ